MELFLKDKPVDDSFVALRYHIATQENLKNINGIVVRPMSSQLTRRRHY